MPGLHSPRICPHGRIAPFVQSQPSSTLLSQSSSSTPSQSSVCGPTAPMHSCAHCPAASHVCVPGVQSPVSEPQTCVAPAAHAQPSFDEPSQFSSTASGSQISMLDSSAPTHMPDHAPATQASVPAMHAPCGVGPQARVKASSAIPSQSLSWPSQSSIAGTHSPGMLGPPALLPPLPAAPPEPAPLAPASERSPAAPPAAAPAPTDPDGPETAESSLSAPPSDRFVSASRSGVLPSRSDVLPLPSSATHLPSERRSPVGHVALHAPRSGNATVKRMVTIETCIGAAKWLVVAWKLLCTIIPVNPAGDSR